MPKTIPLNLVMELGDTNIPQTACKLPCMDKHYIVVRPKDYDKRKKVVKLGRPFLAFTVKAKTKKDLADAIIESGIRYQFKNG
jgi:hypothetical protein